MQDVVTYPDEDKQYFSSRIDKILTHKIYRMPIFLAIMWLIFQTTFTWIGTPCRINSRCIIGGTFTDSKEDDYELSRGYTIFYKI